MSGSYVSASDFLGGVLGETVDFDLADVGLVQLRSLTFKEVTDLNRQHGNDSGALTLGVVALGLVQPVLDADQVQQLNRARPGAIAALSERIMQLSGMVDKLPKDKANDLGNAVGGGS